MRSFAFLALILFASSAIAGVTVTDGKVTADVTARPLKEVLQGIEQQAGVRITLDDSVAATTVSAYFEDLTVPAGIRKLLEGTGINFAVVAGGNDAPMQIFITGSQKPGTPPRRLDTRPISSPPRGVVTPVQPIPQVQPVSPENMNQMQRERPIPPGMQRRLDAGKANQTNQPNQPNQPSPNPYQPQIPTAGGISATPQVNQPKQDVPPNQVDEDDEDDYDEE